MNLHRYFLAFAFVSAAISPTTSVADEEKLNPWTQCGIGAMIFSELPAAAVISNVIWDLGTTAVTSAAGSPHTCEGKDIRAAIFINETYANIEEETAIGKGAHVTAMLNILGCKSAAHEAIIDSVRVDFSEVVSQSNYARLTREQKAQDYYFIVQSNLNEQFSQQCSAV